VTIQRRADPGGMARGPNHGERLYGVWAEPCADYVLSAAARRAIWVGGGGAPTSCDRRRRREQKAGSSGVRRRQFSLVYNFDIAAINFLNVLSLDFCIMLTIRVLILFTLVILHANSF